MRIVALCLVLLGLNVFAPEAKANLGSIQDGRVVDISTNKAGEVTQFDVQTQTGAIVTIDVYSPTAGLTYAITDAYNTGSLVDLNWVSIGNGPMYLHNFYWYDSSSFSSAQGPMDHIHANTPIG